MRSAHSEASREADRRAARSATDPTFASRFECKYLIDPRIVPAVRDIIRPFTRPDRFATLRADLRYPVSSLYLDSNDLALYMQTVAGEKERYKLRVRTYSDDPNSRAFFEVKQKVNAVVHKRRAGLTRTQAASVLEARPLTFLDDLSPDRRDDLLFFDHHASRSGARPLVRVKYLREAYEAIDNEPVRVTMDFDLMHAVTLDGDLSHGGGRWTATPLDGVILEIKFTSRFPWWVQELVRSLGLCQRAVPKYVLSVDHLLLRGRSTALSIGGLTLPPREA